MPIGSSPEPLPGAAPEHLADQEQRMPLLERHPRFLGRVWDVVADRFDFHGEELTREYVAHPGAVAVLAMDEQERVLLIRQYRHPVGRLLWEVPAGLLDIAGEDPLTAAKRELAEEADLEADDWHVLSDFLTSPGGSSEAIRIYLARGVRARAEVYARSGEEAQLIKRWVGLDQAVQAVLERRIQNPSCVIAVLAAHASRAAGWTSLADAASPWPRPSGRFAAG